MACTPTTILIFLFFSAQSFASDPTPAFLVAESLVTEPPVFDLNPTRVKRNIFDDAKSYADSLLEEAVSFATDGVVEFLQDLPTGEAVLEAAGVSDVDGEPTQALNIPGYGNWSEEDGWRLRLHGNIFKQPDISDERIEDLANIFLIDTSVEELPPSEAAQAINMTRSIFIVQQDEVDVTMEVGTEPLGEDQEPGEDSETIELPDPTTDQGDFDIFVPISAEGFESGRGEKPPQRINTYVEGSSAGNATAYLISQEGLTIISDIDDILRITKIFDPKEGLLNSFARPYRPFLNMPDVYANWSESMPDLHFHYLTTTPEQVTRNYMEFIYSTYPGGSFDTRPLNFSDISATLSIRKFLLDKVFQTYPQRKFVLVADTTNSDVMKAYPAMAKEYEDQVQCIFLRNTSATEDSNKFPYDTSDFEGLDQEIYMFFRTPDDLMNLDISNGQCYNETVPQNVTFDMQGLPFGLSDDDDDDDAEEDSAHMIQLAEKRVGLLTGALLASLGGFAFFP